MVLLLLSHLLNIIKLLCNVYQDGIHAPRCLANFSKSVRVTEKHIAATCSHSAFTDITPA